MRAARGLRLATLLLPLALAACASGPSSTTPTPATPGAKADLSALEPAAASDVTAALDAGRSVTFVFWQTWCESCEREAPVVVAAAKQNADAILFLGVVPGRDDVVDAAEVERTRAAWGYEFPQTRDRALALSRALGVSGTPTFIVVGPDRQVRYAAHVPPGDWGPLRGKPAAASDCPDGVCPLPPD